MSKWVSRLLYAGVAAALLWILAGQVGLVDTGTGKSTAPGPRVVLYDAKIEAPDVTKAYGDHFEGSFVIYNEGEATAKNCTLWMLEGSSARFDLAPMAKTRIRLKSKALYRKSGSARPVVRIRCAGYEQTVYSKEHPF